MRRRMWTAAIGLLSVTALLACGGGGEPADDTAPPPVGGTPPAATPSTPDAGTGAGAANLPAGVTPEMVAQGQQIFIGAGACAACHGPDAMGTALAPNLTDNEWINISGRNYEEIVNLIKTGVAEPKQAPAPMPARGGTNITDEQVNQVAAYVVSLGN
jgi:mono/diheme cytochrome c family protein